MNKAFCCLLALATFSCGKTERDRNAPGSSSSAEPDSGAPDSGAPDSGAPDSAAPDGGDVDGIHVAVRQRARGYSWVEGAFTGDTLGVVAFGGDGIPGAEVVVTGIEGGSGYSLHELEDGFGRPLGAAPSPEGFFVLWKIGSAAYLAEIGLDGLERWRQELTQEVTNLDCVLDAFGSAAVVVCDDWGAAFVSTCSAGECQRSDFETCRGNENAMTCDEQACHAVRVCSGGEFEYSNIDPVQGTVVTHTLPLTADSLFGLGATPDLVVFGGALLLAHGNTLYELDAETGSVDAVADLSRPRDGENFFLEFDLAATADHLVIAESTCNGALDSPVHGDQVVRVFSQEYEELFSPVQVGHPCFGSVQLATSEAGRVVLMRTEQSLLFEDFDPATGDRQAPVLFDGPTDDSRVEGMRCDGPSCKLAVHDSGIAFSTSPSLTWVDVTDSAIDGAPVIPADVAVQWGEHLTPMLVTKDGQSAVFDLDTLWWLAADGHAVWSEPSLANLTPFWEQGPVALSSWGPEVAIWRLSEAGAQKQAFTIPEYAALCGTEHYVESSDGVTTTFHALSSGAALATLLGQGRVACGAGQLVTFAEGSRPATLHRALASGEPLGDVPLPGIIVRQTFGDDAVYFLTVDVMDPWATPSSQFVLHEVPAQGPVVTQVLTLPEAGFLAGEDPLHVHDGYVHLLWKSADNLMLSRWTRD